jgi:hypothetical protein
MQNLMSAIKATVEKTRDYVHGYGCGVSALDDSQRDDVGVFRS